MHKRMLLCIRNYACIIIFALILAAVPCRAGQVGTVRFGVSISLSGTMSESGNAYLAGIKMRLEEFNKNANKNGMRLDMVVLDDKSNKEKAVENYVELVDKHNVRAVLGPTASTFAHAMRPYAAERKVPTISPSATAPDISMNNDWVFRILFDDSFQGRALARYMAGKLGFKRAAVIVNKDVTYGKTVSEAFQEEFKKAGGTLVAEEWFEWNYADEKEHDFSANLRKIKAAKPQVVLLPGYSWEVAAILRQALTEDVDTVFCGGDTWQNEFVMLESGNKILGSYFIAGRNIDSSAPEMRNFATLYNMSNDTEARQNSFLGYDALSLLIEALKAGDDGESIRDGLYAIRNFRLASGKITIDRENGTLKSGYLYRVGMENDIFVPELVEEIAP
jgi:ABC-type branched-chain amino acid transport systems, periplasmic component